jgi:tetratricopeptide (TPR) repeat protein
MEEIQMKKILTFMCLLAFILAGCTSAPPAESRLMNTEGAEVAASVSGLMSLEEAMAGAVASVEAKTQEGDTVIVVEINSPLPELSDFLCNELDNSLNAGAKLIVLARGQALEVMDAEYQFQMSGMVSDESAMGFGQDLGASVVITGDFIRFTTFSHLYIQAIDMRTAQMLGVYSAKITNGDPVLADVTAPLDSTKAADVSDEVLEHLNKGRSLLAAGIPDSAIEEFNRAIAKDHNFASAYFYRGGAYHNKGDRTRARTDWNKALELDPNNATARNNLEATR